MLLFASIIAIILAVIFLHIGRREIALKYWHAPYIFHVFGISIPVALISTLILTYEFEGQTIFSAIIFFGFQAVAALAYTLTSWITLILSGALVIRLISGKPS
jgi:hypothetical protein